jgi:hypothetical protein
MTNLIKWSLIAFALNVLWSSEGQAGTVNAASCSSAAVKTASDMAVNGDTVVIPNGSCTWTSGISISKQIIISGQTKGSVLITHGAGAGDLLNLTTGSSVSTEVRNLTFLPGTGTGRYIAIGGSGKVPLIHDNYFRVPDFQLAGCIRFERNGGVVYRNTFESLDPNGAGSGCLQLKPLGVSSSWSTASTMGTADSTGTANIYVEANTFTNIHLQVIDCDDNARTVIRYNTFNDSGFVCHGADTSTYGARHTEVYNNTFVFHTTPSGGINYPLNLNWWWYVRGGTGLAVDNVMPNISSQTWGSKPEINFIVQQLHRNAGPDACASSYPALHQIGRGQNNGAEPFYIWGNTGTGLPESPGKQDYTPDECGHDYATYTTANWVQLGRDYFTGTPKPGYTKYPYPHPLTGGGVTGDGAPAAPSNLIVR